MALRCSACKEDLSDWEHKYEEHTLADVNYDNATAVDDWVHMEFETTKSIKRIRCGHCDEILFEVEE
jgi:hypothetical protein